MRVLIADDQKSVGASLAELVGCCSHHVVEVVGSGLEAIQAYAKHQPDVVLMDYWMPKLNGATACRNILARNPAARVILVSGWSPSDDVCQAGALTILAKPVRLERLEAALNAAALMPDFEPLAQDLDPIVADPEPIIPNANPIVPDLESIAQHLEPIALDLQPLAPDVDLFAQGIEASDSGSEPIVPDLDPFASNVEPIPRNLQPTMPDFG